METILIGKNSKVSEQKICFTQNYLDTGRFFKFSELSYVFFKKTYDLFREREEERETERGAHK